MERRRSPWGDERKRERERETWFYSEFHGIPDDSEPLTITARHILTSVALGIVGSIKYDYLGNTETTKGYLISPLSQKG